MCSPTTLIRDHFFISLFFPCPATCRCCVRREKKKKTHTNTLTHTFSNVGLRHGKMKTWATVFAHRCFSQHSQVTGTGGSTLLRFVFSIDKWPLSGVPVRCRHGNDYIHPKHGCLSRNSLRVPREGELLNTMPAIATEEQHETGPADGV